MRIDEELPQLENDNEDERNTEDHIFGIVVKDNLDVTKHRKSAAEQTGRFI